MFDFDPINSKEADAQQRRLIESLTAFKNSFVSLNHKAEALYEVRIGAALGVMSMVDELVSRFSNQPQEFPKAIKQFWDADARIRDLAAMLHEAEGLTEQVRVGPESIAKAMGVDAAAAASVFLSARMLSSLGGPTLRKVLGMLTTSTTAYGIAGSASAGLASLLGAGLTARIVAVPTMTVPLVGQIIGPRLLVLTGKHLWDAAKTNAELARRAAEARAKVEVATQEVLTQGIYLEGNRCCTARPPATDHFLRLCERSTLVDRPIKLRAARRIAHRACSSGCPLHTAEVPCQDEHNNTKTGWKSWGFQSH